MEQKIKHLEDRVEDLEDELYYSSSDGYDTDSSSDGYDTDSSTDGYDSSTDGYDTDSSSDGSDTDSEDEEEEFDVDHKFTRKELKKLKLPTLKKICVERGLKKYAPKKEEYIARILTSQRKPAPKKAGKAKTDKKPAKVNKKRQKVNKTTATSNRYFQNYSCKQLRAALEALGCTIEGNKAKLIKRLARATADCLDSRVKKLR